MSKTKRIIQLAEAINKKLASDSYGSVEEWSKRHTERLADMGYTKASIEEMTRDACETALRREEAKQTLDGLINAKCHLGSDAPDAVRAQAKAFVLRFLRDHAHFIGVHIGTDFKRYAKHIAVFSKKSVRIKNAYRVLFEAMRSNEPYLSYVIACTPVADIDKFARIFGYRFWAMHDTEQPAFYEMTSFVKCPRTKLEAPSSRMVPVIVDETGRTVLMHPTVLDSRDIRRDAVSGSLILVDAVEWVTLSDGSMVWRSMNEARGAIYLEDGVWQRGATNGRVAGYHGAPREWRSRSVSRSSFRDHIGVELECGFKTDLHLEKFVNRFVETNGRFANNRPFLIERDSSLGGVTGGVEIVSEPLPLFTGYQASDAHWRWLLEHLSHNGAEGWKHRRLAGIHVNTDVSNRTPAQILRFVVFIHNAAAISKFIAGRKKIYGHEGEGNASDSELADLDKFVTLNTKSAYTGGYMKWDETTYKRITGSMDFGESGLEYFAQRGKYSPVHVRGNGVLETRIFGSNIRYEGFMACVEYCVGGMEFTCGLESDLAVLDADIGARFRSWLASNTDKYPNLASRIGVIATSSSSKTVVARPLAELVA